MKDHLHPLGFERLITWILRELEHSHTVFGLHEDLFLTDLSARPLALTRNGQRLESPVGAAAGPHTQLSQNLVAAWLCGARFLELKTVQDLDELTIARPCIDMADEGYNCEWSQELRIDQSFAEYADAWTAIRLLQHRAGCYDPATPGFAFNLSVGYDLAGIRGPKVQGFLDSMRSARAEVEKRLAAVRSLYPDSGDIIAPETLADSVTLSTMHGCPPEEIERIARYLIEERGLHTTVKLNPTLLGAVELRGLLNDTLGFTTKVPDEAFAHDIDFATAVDMVRSLQTAADKVGVDFGVKLTNTLECRNIRNVFPADEGMMYMSGRALHPVSVAVARKLQGAVGGGLDMSFAGGADAWNVADVLACGLGPVTVCSDLLRPGGYQRLRQYLEETEQAVKAAGAVDVDGLAGAMTLDTYAEKVSADPRYRAEAFEDRSIKTERPLPAFDCIAAPCVTTCPAGQDIPGYMRHTADGDDAAALATVLRDNPLPSVTGMVCENPCLERCTRVHYEGALRIRDVKRYLAGTAEALPPPPKVPALGRKVAVVGAGPAGLACAMALISSGVEVTIFEAKDQPGGMVSGAIPAFRLEDADLQRDLDRMVAAGVDLRYGETIDRDRLESLRRDHDAVFLGLGAQRDRDLDIPGEDLPGVMPALKFLAAASRSELGSWTGEVAVIGGGNSAMDAARTAVRLGSEVKVVYRRTQAEMPADADERRAILAEGVEVLELLAPLSVAPQDGRLALTCQVMRLGDPDDSGRRRPEPVDGSTEVLLVDHVIPAVGQRLVWDGSGGDALKTDDDGRLIGEDGCYTGGDARRGPASIVTAMADGRRAARAMLVDFGEAQEQQPTAWPAPQRTKAERQDRASRLVNPRLPEVRYSDKAGDFDLVIASLDEADARAEADRCLSCDQVCDLCVSVCPNRANISYETPGVVWPLVRIEIQPDGFATTPAGTFTAIQGRQTANIADFCNACGNCTTFCPTEGSPFQDKPRLAVSEVAFAHEDDAYRLIDGVIHHRYGGMQETLRRQDDTLIYETDAARVTLEADNFALRDVVFKAATADTVITLDSAAAMALLLMGLAGGPLDSSC